MALTFLGMQTEVYARGFTYLSPTADTSLAGQTRVKRWLNDARNYVNELANWPYLNATAAISSGSSIADLWQIESVTDAANLNQLLPRDRRDLRESFGDLSATGTALYYYVTGGTTITTYPVTSASLTVDYWKFEPDMSADADVPLMPDRYRMAIVHYAVAQAHRDADNDQSAAMAQQDGDRVVASMQQALLYPSRQGPTVVMPLIGDDQ